MSPRPVGESESTPLIPQYYSGKDVFITGATGFMGKVLVARLLATCPGIGRLHLLVRDKRGLTCDKRLQLLKESQVFDVVRARCPAQLDKLRLVAGDTARPRLALTAHAINQLKHVSVVFHCAATLRFDEPLGAAVDQNVCSVLGLMDICDQLQHLEVLVHVSTAYSNTEHGTLEERVYPPPAPLAHALTLAAALPPHLLAEITPGYIAPKPNTYTFTKALAESAILERSSPSSRYSTAIFRPSIVIAALRDPLPGWVEGLNGPSGVVVGTGKGLLHVLRCRAAVRADMIPVDIAIDTMIAVAWHIGTHRPRAVRVYNCCSAENPVSWHQFEQLMMRALHDHPFDDVLWYPYGFPLQNRLLYSAAETLLQTLPLNALALLGKLFGMKTKVDLSVASDRLRAMNRVLKFFSLHEWHFETDNFRALRNSLSPADACIYNLDPHTIDWESMVEKFVIGARSYILREKEDNIPRARRHMLKLRILHNAFLCLLAFSTFRILRGFLPGLIKHILKISLTHSRAQSC